MTTRRQFLTGLAASAGLIAVPQPVRRVFDMGANVQGPVVLDSIFIPNATDEQAAFAESHLMDKHGVYPPTPYQCRCQPCSDEVDDAWLVDEWARWRMGADGAIKPNLVDHFTPWSDPWDDARVGA